MCGEPDRRATMMLGLTSDGFIPTDHPLRWIKPLADPGLHRISSLFDAIYAARNQPSIPPTICIQVEPIDGLLHDSL